jgi:DNA (cytosine-5)-methyltransferase 3A
MIALVVGNHNVERYVAFENETKYATKTASHNFPDIEQRGDVFEADFTEFEGFDVVLAGFPCTKFSVAQKKERETEPYSGEGWLLFEQAWRAVCEAKPKYFLFENNKSMAKAVQSEISKIVGFEPDCINSALVSAQNRNRLYWVGKRNEDGTYSKVEVSQPEDKGILLKDILDGGFALQDIDNEPVCVAERGRYGADGIVEQHYEPREDGKTNVLTTVQKDNQVCEPVRVGTYPNNAKNQAHDSQQYRIYSIEAKSVTLCGNGGGMGAKTGLYSFEVPIYAEVTEWDENGKPIKAKSYADGKEYPVYEVKDGQITIKGKTYPIKLKDGFYIIRKLTVRECMRLQTVPEWYEFPVSDSQAYKMLGNGWTVDVIVHILSFIREG